ncbi:hypothetical protein FQR65_LT18579 [Abscondita terminalis]|nr:hypothetical protein FQR65_LT18579 [Abscondita terminalis]
MHATELENEKDNCLVCRLKVLLFLSKFCGISSYNNCPHDSSKTSTTTMVVSKFYQFVPLFLLIPQMLHIYNTIFSFQESTELVAAIEDFIKIVLFCYLSVIWIILQWKTKEQILQFQGLLFILEYRFYYGIDSFITEDMKKMIKYSTYCFTIFFLITESFYIVNICKEEIFSYALTIDFMATTIAYYLEGVFMYQTYILVFLYKNVYRKFTNEVKLKLECKKKNKQFRRLFTLYMDVTNTYRRFEEVLGFILLLWNITGTLSIILTFFYLFLGYAKGARVNGIVVFHSFGFVIGLMWYMINGDQMKNVADSLSSFLFKYPISKLSLEEATQIELFIITLRMYKPILTASDMFTVETNLLSSISGTVVTYVLVALQFYATENQ